jgi:hypothetical protein
VTAAIVCFYAKLPISITKIRFSQYQNVIFANIFFHCFIVLLG